MRTPDGTVIFCQECAAPWGVLGESQADELVAAYHVWWAEHCVDATWPVVEVCDAPEPPTPTEAWAFWISETDARWLNNIGFDLEIGDPPCWNEWWPTAVPYWWAQRRLRRVTRWDCCNLDRRVTLPEL